MSALTTTSPTTRQSRIPLLIAIAALCGGSWAACHYAAAGMTLSHWDARAHLVVARRIIDSNWPSWQQIGAVWLPLPHLLNMLPVQVDAWYRSGASAVAISIASMAVAAWAMAAMIIRITASRIAALTAAALLLLNPSVLYLQSTPMTEPVLFAASFLAIHLTSAWIDRGAGTIPHGAGLALAAACLTRYEGWPITATALVLAAIVLLRRGHPIGFVLRASLLLAAYPLAAIALFLFNSRWTTGRWFIGTEFFVVENIEALGRPAEAWRQLRLGLYRLSGKALVWSAYAGLALMALTFLRSRARASIVLMAPLCAAAALPIYAYVHGHGFRIRYDVPLVAAAAALAGAGVALLPALLRPVAAIAIVVMAVVQAPPLDSATPIIAEALRDARNIEERRTVTAYLQQHYDGTKIMASMGSVAHYMHDLSHAGLRMRDFLHEGNGEIWTHAFLSPRGHAGWILMEEKTAGGDTLFARSRDPRFLSGYQRVAAGGGVALYRANIKR